MRQIFRKPEISFETALVCACVRACELNSLGFSRLSPSYHSRSNCRFYPEMGVSGGLSERASELELCPPGPLKGRTNLGIEQRRRTSLYILLQSHRMDGSAQKCGAMKYTGPPERDMAKDWNWHGSISRKQTISRKKRNITTHISEIGQPGF